METDTKDLFRRLLERGMQDLIDAEINHGDRRRAPRADREPGDAAQRGPAPVVVDPSG